MFFLTVNCLLVSYVTLIAQNWEYIGSSKSYSEVSGFGRSVSISDDGETIAIGAPYSSSNRDSLPFVAIYKKIGFNMIGTKIYCENDGSISNYVPENEFGYSVSLSKNGNTLAVGIRDANEEGHVKIYRYIDNTWIQIGGNMKGKQRWFDRIGRKNYVGFGSSVSLSDDGNIVAIGAWRDDCTVVNVNGEPYELGDGESILGANCGSITIYQFDGSNWTQMGKDIMGSNGGDQIGSSIALSGNGKTFAFGALDADYNGRNSGLVRVYKFTNNDWSQINNDLYGRREGDNFGISISLSQDGNTLAVGANGNDDKGTNIGQVKVFKNIDENWSQIGSDINGQQKNDQCYSVSLSNDGKTLAVGSPYNDGENRITGDENYGHVRVFRENANQWLQIGEDIESGITKDFGKALSLSGDGKTIVVNSSNRFNSTLSASVLSISEVSNKAEILGNSIHIYPNPAQDQITVSSSLKIDSYQILNLLGEKVLCGSLANPTIRIESLHSGSYLLVLEDKSSNQAYYKKFIK